MTFEVPIKAKVRLTSPGQEVIESEVYLGDLPLMTEKGTFVINGAERVVVSQLSRSAGIYFRDSLSNLLEWQFFATLIPSEGPWVDIETDGGAITVRIGQNKKFSIMTLLRALHAFDVASPEGEFVIEFRELVGKTLAEPIIDEVTGEVLLDKGAVVTTDDYRNLLKALGGEQAVRTRKTKCLLTGFDLETDSQLLDHFGTRVSLSSAEFDQTDEDPEARWRYAATDLYDGAGKLIVPAYARIDREAAKKLMVMDQTGVEVIEVHRFIGLSLAMEESKITDRKSALHDIYHKIRPGDPVTDESAKALLHSMFFDTRRYDLAKVGRHKLNKKLRMTLPLSVRTITKYDLIAVIEYLIGMQEASRPDASEELKMRFTTDDIDHLENKRVRSVGELLYSQLRMGFLRMEKVAKERMTQYDAENIIPQVVLSVKPVSAAIKSFFGSSQLSQFMDQTNPLAELTHKRRLSALGPGGLSRQSAKLEVRDVHHSHYGRICPIETPEGPNIGLIGSLAVHARVDPFGFIETPYRRVIDGKVSRELDWLPADNEHHYHICPASVRLNEDGSFITAQVQVRHNHEYPYVPAKQVDYMDVSPQQLVSVGTSLIPFLENDDANRALMGANMQRQAVPTLRPDAPLVKTGMERRAALDSGAIIVAKRGGRVKKVTSEEIIIETREGRIDRYWLLNMIRSNQATCITQRPVVEPGQRVRQGQVLADGPCTDGGELALGQNVLVAFMPWNGYNYEDAILLSRRMVKDDVYTSIHIEKYEAEARDTKLGPEEMTRDIPNVGEDALKDLDEDGIIRIGAEVRSDDILIGKVAPKGQGELTAEERLIIAIFGKKAEETRDVSLRVPHGEKGKIVDVKVFSRYKYKDASGNIFNFSKRPDSLESPYDGSELERLAPDELQAGVNKLVRVYIAQKRKIMEGDKMAGRHGNKGVVSKIMPEENMPFLPDGTPVDIVLNPLGVPSRMNIGQIMETHLGLVAKEFGAQFVEPIFEGSNEEEILNEMGRFGEKRRREMLIRYVKSDLELTVDFPEVGEGGQNLEDLLGPMEAALRDLESEELERVSTILAGPEVPEEIPADYPYDLLIDEIRDRVWRRVGFHEDKCKMDLRDGRTGESFNMPVTVGNIYMLKLAHLVDDKIHARSTGPYSLVTQQPLGGKAQFGGQRFGEMEVWALEAYGAAYTLQEILTIKSDDVLGRVKTYESIVKGEPMLEPGVPESFKILVNELQSLALKVTVEDATGAEIDLKDKDEDFLDDEANRRRAQIRRQQESEDLLLS
ncbi:DNA-directed RNA polymerase subunit beta [Armatimonas rosea]|uniref:DNA-directed RNA polymerase subunit beta n=1 Tax=Armatimonas rosea TaxID=685828 RepID=A0A7W9W9I8_ARMRO|nr:DNA-directed RNA polymerase subunit beta [Armatimonas rosea]